MSTDVLSDTCFDEYRKIVHNITGITIDKNRKTMLIGRVKKRILELDLDSYESYLEYLDSNKSEEAHFTNLITTNETYFYRTPRIWDFVENEFLPNFLNNNSTKVNIWSAASSTGDEAHTLGIVCESFKDKNSGFSYNVLGTDISESVVKRATDGIYIGRPVQRFRDTRKELFNKYMIGNDKDGHKVIPRIKANIKFKTHNLFNTFKGNDKFDLILLRNVLIYFTKEDQEKVIQNIYDCLSPHGFLIIGESESLSRINTRFESVKPLIYRPIAKEDEEAAA